MNNVVNKVAYLRTTRSFPGEVDQLSLEVNKSYLDIATAVNTRMIGIFPTNQPAITGESWFITNNRQQTLRQVYPITGAGSYPHGIKDYAKVSFTRIYGTYTDEDAGPFGPFWYPIPFVSVVAAGNQVNIFLNRNNIVITAGGGNPPIVRGYVVLEWLVTVENLAP